MDSLFRSTTDPKEDAPQTTGGFTTIASIMDFANFYRYGSDRETARADDSHSIHSNDPSREEDAVVGMQQRNVRGLVVDGNIEKDFSPATPSYHSRGCGFSTWARSTPARCLKGWSSRERFLLALVIFNTIVIFGLLCSNIVLLQKMGGGCSNQTALASIESRSTSVSRKCDGEQSSGAPAAENSSIGGYNSGVAEVQVGDPDELCGCAACTQQVWNNPAGDGATCGERIRFLTSESSRLYPTQVHACRRIAFEFPCACGGCDPSQCHLPTPEFVLPTSYVPPQGATPAPTPIPAVVDPMIEPEKMDIYCFPPPDQRATFKLWGGMIVQVKEDASQVCGPGSNRFSRDTVAVDEANQTITLQYKNGVASEVRILLPQEERPFTYGTYSFSVQSVVVKDSAGAIVSNVLPKDLVLGLFTWDSMENYDVRENYNHEVDIEISRWGCETNSDLQFLVQPPGLPQMHRLFSGKDPATPEGKYSQGGHVYGFTWNPGHIDWITSAGGPENNRFVLKTEEAVYRNAPDYVQCLPDVGGDTEVRLNLWNFLGAIQPSGTSSVEVVIDGFSFTPSGLSHVPVGAICTKHCQCSGQCIDHKCTE